MVSYHSKKKIIHLPDNQVVTKNVGIALLYMSLLDVTRVYVYTHRRVRVSYSYKKKANCLTFSKLNISLFITHWLSVSYKL